MPPKKPSGIDITNAQGHDTIRNDSALCIQSVHSPWKNSGGMTASSTASPQTTGVYILAKRVMNFSDFALLAAAFSTRSSILAAVDSEAIAVVRSLSVPSRLTVPLLSSEPSETSTGSDSPVSAAVSMRELPCSTTPSRGIFSPGLMNMTEPTGTSSGSTFIHSPFFSTLA